MNITGKIVEIFETQQIKETFRKREFVVEYADNPSYPELIKFELIQDKCDLLDPFNTGDEVNVEFNLKGRKWEDKTGQVKYFNSLQAWRIDEKRTASPVDQPPLPSEEPLSADNETDDLPF